MAKWMLAAMLLLSACQGCAAPKAAAADNWVGRWTGPEGTFLDLAKAGSGYTVTIRDLDGEKTYSGTSSGEAIQFERAGATETIRHGNGQETGMKWLAEKKDCLIVKAGEGYCRD